jgi:hypothetical protein
MLFPKNAMYRLLPYPMWILNILKKYVIINNLTGIFGNMMETEKMP